MRAILTSRAAMAVAAAAGYAARWAYRVRSSLGEAAGVAFVSYGLGLAWRPLAFVAVGAALLVHEWRRHQ